MKKITPLFWMLFIPLIFIQKVSGQDSSKFSTYYFQRYSHFKTLPSTAGEIVFLGNSITDGAEWSELFKNSKIKNRGISGDNTDGVLYRLKEVTNRKPEKVFLMIGVNDLAQGKHPESILKNQILIVKKIRESSPATGIYVQSILPVNSDFGKFGSHVNKGKEILYINRLLKDSSTHYGYTFIGLHSAFEDESGKMKPAYTNDGLHLTGDGYLLWKQIIYPYVFDAEPKPSLIPLPQKLSWQNSFFNLYECNGIVLDDSLLIKEASYLTNMLRGNGWDIPILKKATGKSIELKIGRVETTRNPAEAYHLKVTDSGIRLTANTSHGIFNGIQTLRQLMRDGATVPACKIIDWPAFSWRGYMIDVGRNFMPLRLLKQQIEMMSRYKLNVFHFHFTEDIAWRLAIKRYPQLTDASTMLRNPGMFYSETDMKELIAFCNERHITLMPEIDMPGHSAAFKRAMGVDMQTDSGLQIVKNILKEFFDTYDLPYIHIGADEVKITMQNFLPDVIRFIKSYNKKIIGWEPGGNFTDDVIHQLWMGDEAPKKEMTGVQFIDSRHLYLNHMDPLEAVTTLYFREIGNQSYGDSQILGATLCTWNDRRVEEAEDIIRMNPVYPGMLAFAERSWIGGGRRGWTAAIGEPGSEKALKFMNFENRMMDQKHQYFSGLPFPYTPQSGMKWMFYGPYKNGGNLSEKFGPEKNNFDTAGLKPLKQVTGGTIMLRHWWYPMVKGALDNPAENSTVYAHAKIWSDIDRIAPFWIGFNNISRSPNTDSPPKDEWDERKSEVFVNGTRIPAPDWKRGGMKGDPEVPLTDEGYEYREPTRIALKKGWNSIWVKSPVGKFAGRDWHNPVKWEFTFIEIKE